MASYELEDDLILEDDPTEWFFESDEDWSERRKRRKQPRKVTAGKTGKGGGYYQSRPTDYVTQPQLQAALARVGQDIKQTSESVQRVAAQVNSATSTLSAANAEQDANITRLRRELKQQADNSMLLLLLQKPPQLEAKNAATAVATAGDVINNVQFKKETNLLPLVLLMGQGQSGGSGGSDNSMLFAMLAMSGQL